MDDSAKIRRAHRDGLSIRELARPFHPSRYKVRPILAHAEPQPYPRAQPPPAPVLGSFHAVLDAILAAAEHAPPKQRPTAMPLYRRRRDEYASAGGSDQVRRSVARHRRDHRETFLPLAPDPGQRREAAFGPSYVASPAGRRPVPLLVTAGASANAPFAVALPTERTEAIWATPAPPVSGRDARNAHLLACCRRQAEHTVTGQHEPLGARFARDRARALPLPGRPFEACAFPTAPGDQYQAVPGDRHRSSVPRAHAFGAVTVQGSLDHVAVVAAGQVVARHARCYGPDEQILDPLHYLATLGRRPAALGPAPVWRGWPLPAAFATPRQALERQHGPRAGCRHSVRVLPLRGDPPVERVAGAVESGLGQAGRTAERGRAAAERRAAAGGAGEAVTPLGPYPVPRPDLGRFNQLLTPGDSEEG